MSIDWGWNFRATVGYVTDGANQTFEDGATYPHTYTGLTGSPVAGWQTGGAGIGGSRDRDNSIDVRLAGIVFDPNNAHWFQVDLPSTGAFDIWLAMGDATSSNNAYWDLYDDTSVFASFTQTPASGHFVDATGADYSAAAWPGSQSKITRTFGSTTFKMKVTSTSGNSVIASLRIATSVATGRLARVAALEGLGGAGQQAFNPSLAGV